MAVRIEVKGLEKALKDLDKKGDDVIKAVADVLEDVAKKIEINASSDAPAFVPQIPELPLNIGSRIRSEPVKTLNGEVIAWEVFVNTDYTDPLADFDGYMEFNTGLQASQLLSNPNYTPEIKALAYEYYKTGKGTLRGNPYFYPNVFRYTANFEKDIEEAIKKAIK